MVGGGTNAMNAKKKFSYPYPEYPKCLYCDSKNTRIAGIRDKIQGTKKYKCLDCGRIYHTGPRKSTSSSREYFIRLIGCTEAVFISSRLSCSLGLEDGSYLYVVEEDNQIILTKGRPDKGFKLTRHNKFYSLQVCSYMLYRYLIDKLELDNQSNIKIRTNQEGRIMEIISKNEIRKKYEKGRFSVEKFLTVNKNGSVRISVALIKEIGIEPNDQLILLNHGSDTFLSLASTNEIKSDLGFNVYMDGKFKRTALSSNISLAKYLYDKYEIKADFTFRIYTSKLMEIKNRNVVRLEKTVII